MATPTSMVQVRLPVTTGSGDINYLLNPSAEGGSGSTPSNVFGYGATVTRVTTFSRQVAPDSSYSYRIQTSAPNNGIQLVTASLPSGNIYMSAWIRGTFTPGNIRFYNALGSQILTPTLYETDGSWHWYVLDTTPITSASGQTSVFIIHTTSGADFYVDDAVVQAGALTTAFHSGYPGCRPNGIAHQSSTQLLPLVDNEPNNAAGVIYDFDHTTTTFYSHYIAKVMGLGLPTIENLTQKTIEGGEQFVSSQLGSRNIALTSSLLTSSIANQHSQRAYLIDRVSPGRKFVFRYRGNPTYNGGTNDVVEVTCVYAQGLPGNLEMPGWENLSITLTAYDPLFYPSSETATALSMASSQTISYAMRRRLGEWALLGTGTDPDVFIHAMAVSPKGHVYVGGDAGAFHLRGWDGTSWTNCGVMVGGNKIIYALAFDPSGKYLYVGGDWTTTIGGVANTVYIARYELPTSGVGSGTWTALSTGMNGLVRSIVTVPTSSGHDVYAFGAFTTAGGTSTNYAAKWNGSAWSALGPNSATATRIDAAVYDQSNLIYFGGSLTSIGTIAAPGAPVVGNTSGSLTSANWRYAIAARTSNGTTLKGTSAVSGSSTTGKTLSWSAVTGAISYDIYREDPVTTSNFWFLANTTGLSYTDDGSVTLSDIDEPAAASDGTRSTNVGRYNIALNSFEYVGSSGTTGEVKALALSPEGVLYLGGAVTAADGVAVGRVAQYNGQIISAMSDNRYNGVTGGDVESLLVLPTGEVAIGGAFTAAGATLLGTTGANLVYWQPSQGGSGLYAPANITFPSSTTVYALMLDINGDLWTGSNTTGTNTTSVATTVTAAGMAGVFQSYPRLYIVGPGVFRYLENNTTGHRIWFNLPVATDEVVTLDFRLGNKTMTSSFANAPRASKFVAGDFDLFGLLNGTNKIIAYFTGTSGNATLRLSDPSTRLSADG